MSIVWTGDRNIERSMSRDKSIDLFCDRVIVGFQGEISLQLLSFISPNTRFCLASEISLQIEERYPAFGRFISI